MHKRLIKVIFSQDALSMQCGAKVRRAPGSNNSDFTCHHMKKSEYMLPLPSGELGHHLSSPAPRCARRWRRRRRRRRSSSSNNIIDDSATSIQ